jgi:hypothetical protein
MFPFEAHLYKVFVGYVTNWDIEAHLYNKYLLVMQQTGT